MKPHCEACHPYGEIAAETTFTIDGIVGYCDAGGPHSHRWCEIHCPNGVVPQGGQP